MAQNRALTGRLTNLPDPLASVMGHDHSRQISSSPKPFRRPRCYHPGPYFTSGGNMEKVLYIILGGLGTLLLTPFIHPLSKNLEVASRRLYRIKPVHVHVEREPSIVWAGFPNWIGAAVWLPSLPSSDPPEGPTDWHRWAKSIGGTDASITYLKITITCKDSASVVVNPPKVRRDSLPVGNPPKGIIAVKPTGGAAVTPRRIQVGLDMGTSNWLDEDGNPIPALSLALDPGESEQFYIFASASIGRYEWHLELPIIVDGRRRIIKIDDGGDRFMTHGTDGLTEHFWHNGFWQAGGIS